MKSCNKIFLLRHLKTINNDQGIISGQSDATLMQVNPLKTDLSIFDKIYCSPSIRCKKTIESLEQKSLLYNKVTYDERLLERNMGKFEGMSKIKCKEQHPDLFYKDSFDVFGTPPNGESFENFKTRVEEFYNDHLITDANLNILICSHNQTLKLLRLIILEKEITEQTWLDYSFDNGEIIVIDVNI